VNWTNRRSVMSRAIERRCAGGRPGRGSCAWRPLFLPIWTIDLRDQFCAQPPARCSEAAVEHDEEFTGAGLYESRRGCSADDLDSETTEKPCGWDLGEPDQLDGLGVIRKDHAVFSYGPEHLPGTLTSGGGRIQRGHGTDRYHPLLRRVLAECGKPEGKLVRMESGRALGPRVVCF
jgi:hypothetical protein